MAHKGGEVLRGVEPETTPQSKRSYANVSLVSGITETLTTNTSTAATPAMLTIKCDTDYIDVSFNLLGIHFFAYGIAY